MSDRDTWVPEDAVAFATFLGDLAEQRSKRKEVQKAAGAKRRALDRQERDIVLSKTAGRCHICGGEIDHDWQADHVLAHSGGGDHNVDNYLPAHPLCNSYRWDYVAAEFHEILRLGVWLRTQIQRKTEIGRAAVEAFIKHGRGRISRRKDAPAD